MVEIGLRAILIKARKKMLFLPSEASPFPTGSSFGLRTEKTGSGSRSRSGTEKTRFGLSSVAAEVPGSRFRRVPLSPRLVRAFPPPKIYRLSARFQLKASRSRIFSLIGFNRNIGGRLHGCSEQM